MSYIQSIGLCDASFCYSQQEILDFMLDSYEVPSEHIDKVKRLYERSEIDTRYSAINDFTKKQADRTFYKYENGAALATSVEERMKTFFLIAPALCEKAIVDCLKDVSDRQSITHLITVTCTGLSAPGLDIQLIQQLGFSTNLHRSSINFMGCYAAIHALKQADSICKANHEAKVLIVDVELCTLHFQHNYSMENVAASLLFADGAAAVLVSNEPGHYSIEHFYSEIAFSGYNEMAWQISSNGFLMTLSGYIPAIIAENIEPMLLNSLRELKLTKNEINHWAVHPGGKKILNEIEKALDLDKNALIVSRSILRDYGNMSSVTVIYVLKKMLDQVKQSRENVYSVAFGPGLTIESMFLKSC